MAAAPSKIKQDTARFRVWRAVKEIGPKGTVAEICEISNVSPSVVRRHLATLKVSFEIVDDRQERRIGGGAGGHLHDLVSIMPTPRPTLRAMRFAEEE